MQGDQENEKNTMSMFFETQDRGYMAESESESDESSQFEQYQCALNEEDIVSGEIYENDVFAIPQPGKKRGRPKGSYRKRKFSDSDGSQVNTKRRKKLPMVEVSALVAVFCCASMCLPSLPSDVILTLRDHLSSLTKSELSQWMLDWLWTHPRGKNEFCFLIGEWTVCLTAFLTAIGMPVSTFYSIRKRYIKGEKVIGRQGLGAHKRSSAETASLWILDYANKYAEKQPDQLKFHLPPCLTKASIYDMYMEEMGDAISLSHFYWIWRKCVSYVVIPSVSRFSKCNICSQIKTKLAETKDRTIRARLQKERERHLLKQSMERRKYYKHCMKSRQDPQKYMSIIIDAMDQSKTEIPHFMFLSTIMKGMWKLRTHLIGAIVHGVGIYGFFDYFQYPHASNLSIHVLLHILYQHRYSLPDTLYLQMDNCARENKNNSSSVKEKGQSPTNSSNSSVDLKMAGQNLLPAFPAANSPQRLQPTGRAKVVLKPGRSLMDWIRLGRSSQDLNGFKGQTMDISIEELTRHNKEDDAWIAIRGKVYNVTAYMEYHPGGIEELMRGAGQDGTQLFDEVHKWVNFESMLEKCYIGKLKAANPIHKRVQHLKDSQKSDQKKLLPLNGPSLAELKPPSGPIPPRFDWFQSVNTVTVVIYTKCKNIRRDCIIIKKTDSLFFSMLNIEDYTYFVDIELENKVKDNYDVRIQKETGKVEIILSKETEEQWKSIGHLLDRHNTFIKTKGLETEYHRCSVESISEVSHDCKLLCVKLPQDLSMYVPLGHHVHIQHEISGMEIVRSYTAVLKSLSPDIQDDRPDKVIYLMIKIYKDGALTPWIGTLSPGDIIDVSYPVGTFKEESLNNVTDLVLYAAGTGFTPMVRLIYHCLFIDNKTNRKVKLMFFNKTEKDILWQSQLDYLAEKYENFTVEYVLSEADDTWKGQKGRINKEMMESFTPAPSETSNLLICACGPTQFTETVSKLAKDLGYSENNFHAFQG